MSDDDLDDKFYDGNTYTWEVMFETVKYFVMKEGRWPRRAREDDKRDVMMADGSTALRDLAMWMCNQRQNKFKGKLDDERERKLTAIRFMWDQREYEWHAMFCAVKRFKDKALQEVRYRISRGEKGCKRRPSVHGCVPCPAL